MTTPEERPPFLGSWQRIYFAVALYLAAVIALLAWFTRSWNWSWNR
ncbi:MAG: hypothetical protein HY821_20940 [Acidobacteria bacterium]|nr:hypothetical protein [Acidobacteriota bacterium]